jgi:hypothetical protein
MPAVFQHLERAKFSTFRLYSGTDGKTAVRVQERRVDWVVGGQTREGAREQIHGLYTVRMNGR